MSEKLSGEQQHFTPKSTEDTVKDLFAEGNHIIIKGDNGHYDYSWEVVEQSEDGEVIHVRQTLEDGSYTEKAFTREELEEQREAFDKQFSVKAGRTALRHPDISLTNE